jgi:general secretion pathway protein C
MNQAYIRKVFLTTKLTLALMLVYVIVRLLLLHQSMGNPFKPQAATGIEAVPVGLAGPDESVSVRDYNDIIVHNIFGGVGLPEEAIAGGPNSPAVTKSGKMDLDLNLLGTIAGSTETSRAIIKNSRTNSVGIYKVGDRLAGALIESINAEAVILEYEGNRKSLHLTIGASRSNLPKAGQNNPSQATLRETTASSARESPPGELPSQTNGDWVEDVLRDDAIEPYSVNGRTAGFEIKEVDNIPMARDLGLENGDIIQTVNGQLITSKQKAFQILKKARSQPGISIQLLRDGKSMELSFDIR